jgi:predicted DNA binding protein
MMYEFEVSTSIRHFWFGELVRELPVNIEILDMISNTDGLIHYLVEVKLEKPSIPILKQIIDDIDGIDLVTQTDISEKRIILTVSVDSCDICQAILRSGCFLKTAHTNNNRILWIFMAPKKEYVKVIIDSLEKLNIDHKLTKLRELGESEVLTPKQETILKVAFEKGYFDHPKGCGIRELAAATGTSTATISTTLKRATKRLVQQHFVHNDCD